MVQVQEWLFRFYVLFSLVAEQNSISRPISKPSYPRWALLNRMEMQMANDLRPG